MLDFSTPCGAWAGAAIILLSAVPTVPSSRSAGAPPAQIILIRHAEAPLIRATPICRMREYSGPNGWSRSSPAIRR